MGLDLRSYQIIMRTIEMVERIALAQLAAGPGASEPLDPLGRPAEPSSEDESFMEEATEAKLTDMMNDIIRTVPSPKHPLDETIDIDALDDTQGVNDHV